MAHLLTRTNTNALPCSSEQLERIQEDLGRLSTGIQNLSLGTDTQLSALPLGEQLDAIHDCLLRFEESCQRLGNGQQFDEDVAETNEWGKIVVLEEKQPDWRPIRTQAQRANRLAQDLSTTLTKLRGSLAHIPSHSPVPSDIGRLNQSLNAAVEGLFTEWNSNPY